MASLVSWPAIGSTAAAVACKDGRTAAAGKGACTRHGGVERTASKDPSGAYAQCQDGMFWHGADRPGACAGHGGVAMWMTGS
jgi:hypothetical protein